MRCRYRLHEPDAPHFVTATVVEWIAFFTTAARGEIVTESLAHGRVHKGLRIRENS